MNKGGLELEFRQTQLWELRYNEVVSFVEEFGHARVPEDFPPNPSLGKWVKRQRYNYKRYQTGDSSTITTAQIRLLSNVGFEWMCKNNQPWHKSYEELVSFVEEFGHARVPQRFPPNPSLGEWVNNQRRRNKKFLKGYASSKVNEDRIELLNKIGFEWECRYQKS